MKQIDLSKLSLQELIDLKNTLIDEFNKDYDEIYFYIDAKLHYEDIIRFEKVKHDNQKY